MQMFIHKYAYTYMYMQTKYDTVLCLLAWLFTQQKEVSCLGKLKANYLLVLQ